MIAKLSKIITGWSDLRQHQLRQFLSAYQVLMGSSLIWRALKSLKRAVMIGRLMMQRSEAEL